MTFGCDSCYGEDAETVMRYCIENLTVVGYVVQDSHFGVSIRECPNCGQRFVAIFTEFVDWVGGNDAQYFDVVPVTEAEAAQVSQLSLRDLGKLGAGRRRVSSDWPSDAASQAISWKEGWFHVREGR